MSECKQAQSHEQQIAEVTTPRPTGEGSCASFAETLKELLFLVMTNHNDEAKRQAQNICELHGYKLILSEIRHD